MSAPWTMAALAAYVPFRPLLRLNIVIDGMAAIAGGAGGALHVVRRVECGPPVRTVRNHVGAPHFVGNVPLRRLRKIVIADFCEVALLPDASIDERGLILRAFRTDVVGGQIGSNCIGMLAWIAHDVGHRRFLPVLVDLLVAFLACRGAHVVS